MCGFKGESMVEDTKLIKQILKEEFPNYKFSIRFKKPSQYIDYSDTIIVACNPDIRKDVIELVQQYTSGIGIYEKGSMTSVNGEVDPKIYNTLSEKWVEVNAEFIMIKDIKK
jgi:hypothetical protein